MKNPKDKPHSFSPDCWCGSNCVEVIQDMYDSFVDRPFAVGVGDVWHRWGGENLALCRAEVLDPETEPVDHVGKGDRICITCEHDNADMKAEIRFILPIRKTEL